MKRALCVKSVEEISNLIKNKADTINTYMIARDICEDPSNEFLQIIPYVVFYSPKLEEGKLIIVQYKRSAKGGEDRLLCKVSVGFGGHIDDADEIKYQSKTSFNGISNISESSNGKPWKQHAYGKSNGITKWKKDTNLIEKISLSQVIVVKDRVYLLGGWNGKNVVSTIYTATIDKNGKLGSWTKSGNLPIPLYASQAVTFNNRVYLLGGCSSFNTVSAIYTANINEDGALGEWRINSNLPTQVSHSQAVVAKDKIYMIGGIKNGNVSNKVYTTSIIDNGLLGHWYKVSSLPQALANSQAVVIKDYIYILGGWNGNTYVSTIYRASINSDGTLGEWKKISNLPKELGNFKAIVINDKLYIIGGWNINLVTSDVYFANINDDGSLGEWTKTISLPEELDNTQAIVTSNYVYLLGGQDNNGTIPTVYRASINETFNDYSKYSTDHFVMTKEDLVDTCINAAKRELSEELGCDILSVTGASIDFKDAIFFMGDLNNPVNQVHLGLGLPVCLDEEQLEKFFKYAVTSPDEIEVMDKMTVNVKDIVEEMDITATNNRIMKQLSHKHGFEDWSVRMFDYIVRKEISELLKDIDYFDLVSLAKSKEAKSSSLKEGACKA